ncbi:MAG: cadherin domain-containing protein [Xenococcus sp. (in: cyanobacteria)]
MAITQLTTNGTAERPDISGNDIVWTENGNDVILFDGTTSTVLPDLGVSLTISPQISPDGLFWNGYTTNGWQIFFYDDSTQTTTQLTNEPYIWDEKLSGNRIAWRSAPDFDPGGDLYEVFVYDNSTQTTTQLTNNSSEESSVDISGNNVVWSGGGVFLHDGVSTTQLTSSGFDSHVSGNQVVWRAYDGGKISEIYLYDGSTTTQIVDSTNSVPLHGFFDGNVVWSEWDGNDWELFRFDGTNTSQITDNDFNDILTPSSTESSYSYNSNAAVDGSGNNLVWSSYVGDNWEVFYYNGTQTIQVTDNSIDDLYPKISGDTLVWNTSGTTSDIFKFEPDANTNFPPTGTDATFSLDENSPNGTVVGTVVASDPNPGQILSYSIQSGNDAGTFAIDSSGQITVLDNILLDYETTPSFNLEIEVSDNGSPSLSDTVSITVDLIDIDEGTGSSSLADDFDPDIDNSQWEEISNGLVNSNFGGSGNSLFFSGGNAGGNSRFAESQVLDLTAGGFVAFDLIFGTSNNGGENADAGEDVVLEYSTDGTAWTELVRYDTEDYTSWSPLVEALPTAAQTTTTALRWRQINHSGSSFDNWGLDNVELLDAGINFAPTGTDATFSLGENSPNGTVVGMIVATDPNPGQILTYSIQSGNDSGTFALDSSGELTVLDNTLLDYETTPSFNLEIEVSDNGSPSLSDTVSITVNLNDIYEGTGTIVVADDLDLTIDNSQWSSVGNSLINSNFSGSNGNSLFFTGGSYQDSSRYVTTNGVDVSNGGEIYFDLIFGTSSNGGENADAGEDVVLEYSTDNGASWVEINLYDTEAYTSWTGINESIPLDAQTNDTEFRWLQVTHSGSSFDNWGLDNIVIEAF